MDILLQTHLPTGPAKSLWGTRRRARLGRGMAADPPSPRWTHSFPVLGRGIRSARKFWGAVGLLAWCGGPEGNRAGVHRGTEAAGCRWALLREGPAGPGVAWKPEQEQGAGGGQGSRTST